MKILNELILYDKITNLHTFLKTPANQITIFN